MEKQKNNDFKNMITGFGVLFLYLILSVLPYDILSLFGINYNNLSLLTKQVYLILYNLLLTSLIIYIYRKDFITNTKDFIKNFKIYYKKYFKYWFLIIGLMVLSNSIITIFTTTQVSQNQTTIIEELKKAPFYTIMITALIAPILEETVFRLSFRKIFAHTDILFIFFSGLIFGSLHVIGSCKNLVDLLFIIPYSIPGFIFAYLLTKSKNILVPISIHAFHNTIMMILQIILLLK